MTKLLKQIFALTLLASLFVSSNNVYANPEVDALEKDVEASEQMTDVVRKKRFKKLCGLVVTGCAKIGTLTVCGNATVGGSLKVGTCTLTGTGGVLVSSCPIVAPAFGNAIVGVVPGLRKIRGTIHVSFPVLGTLTVTTVAGEGFTPSVVTAGIVNAVQINFTTPFSSRPSITNSIETFTAASTGAGVATPILVENAVTTAGFQIGTAGALGAVVGILPGSDYNINFDAIGPV